MEPMSSCQHFNDLPVEVILGIFGRLSVAEVFNCFTVAKHWFDLADDESVWKQHLTREYSATHKQNLRFDTNKRTLRFCREFYAFDERITPEQLTFHSKTLVEKVSSSPDITYAPTVAPITKGTVLPYF